MGSYFDILAAFRRELDRHNPTVPRATDAALYAAIPREAKKRPAALPHRHSETIIPESEDANDR